MIPRRFLVLGMLIFVGEVMFSLPFHIPRYFRATVLDVFALSNTQLGDVFAVYGITATSAYFLGGPLADRFPARKLIATSLLATGAGGLYLSTIPGPFALAVLYGYWGLTTILLFWAALIRATREWGGTSSQGRAFGFLEGGRGLVSACLASLAVIVFSWLFPAAAEHVTLGERLAALKSVIHFYTATTLAAAFLCWIAIPDEESPPRRSRPKIFKGMGEVLRTRSVWAQAMIVLCAYCGYRGLDNFSLYAVQVLDMSELDGARFAEKAAYIRVIAPITAGLIADRFNARRVIGGLFVSMTISYGVLSQIAPPSDLVIVLYANIFISYVAVFALRGVYFALLEETQVPTNCTGTAAGLISVAGFTPDIFFGSISGRILDHSPGVTGHLNYFLLLTGISAVGVVTALILISMLKSASKQPGA